MFTRKLNELQINNVLQHANNQVIETLSIYKNKRGIHMIAYDVATGSSDLSKLTKSMKTIELIRVLKEIRKQVCCDSYQSIKLDYSSNGQLTYQLEFKEQG